MSLLDSGNWPHTCDIFRTIPTNDEAGGTVLTQAGTPYADDQACWYQEASHSQVTEFQAKGQKVTHVIYLESNPGLKLNDAIIVTGGPHDGKEFAIKSFDTCTVGFDLLWEVMAEIYSQTAPTS
jgi:hypothetical protein